MNKKLVALAVAGAFALPLAAQAQTANVTLYGRANVDLEFVRGAQVVLEACPEGAPGAVTVSAIHVDGCQPLPCLRAQRRARRPLRGVP